MAKSFWDGSGFWNLLLTYHHVWALIEESRLNSILMLYDCVGEKLTLKVVRRHESYKLVKTPSFFWCVPIEKWQFRWIMTPRIYGSFGSKLRLLHFCDLSDVAHGEDNRLKFCGGMYLEMWQGKRWRRCQIKPTDRC